MGRHSNGGSGLADWVQEDSLVAVVATESQLPSWTAIPQVDTSPRHRGLPSGNLCNCQRVATAKK